MTVSVPAFLKIERIEAPVWFSLSFEGKVLKFSAALGETGLRCYVRCDDYFSGRAALTVPGGRSGKPQR